jgi:acyl transferase domain-containing protein
MMRFGALSPTGQTACFDESAAGYVRGEGAFCFVLKRLDDALADGDPVHAVIRGCAMNHDGRAGGMVLNDPESQSRLILSSLSQAGLDPADLGYIEAHAAGTPLGDSQELQGLLRVIATRPEGIPKRMNGPEGRQWVGSVKANIGHLEGAAGAAGLAKAILSLRHAAIPATAGFARLNHRVDLADMPVALTDRLVPWPDSPDGPRRAGVNSFGVGGANAHVVLEEPPREAAVRSTGGELRPIPLSAASETAMIELAERLREFLARPEAPGFDSVAWTLQTGRAQLNVRRVLLARDNAGLRTALMTLTRGEPSPDVCAPGDAIEAFPPAQVWLDGGRAEWRTLWREAPPRRVPIVPYPFQRRHYWFDEPTVPEAGDRAR